MARHGNGKNTFAVARWVIVVTAVALVTLIGGAAWFFGFRHHDTATPEPAPSTSLAAGTSTKPAVAPNTGAATVGPISPASPAPTHSHAPVPAPTTSAAVLPAATPADTLMLLDTSAAMAPYFPAATGAVTNVAGQLGTKGKSVALWNYSSPLSKTARVGYRENLGFGSAAPVAQTVSQFGTGGVPQTRSAVLAALKTAGQRAGSRVVLVTTGTQQDMPDAAFNQALQAAKGTGVKLAVVHLTGAGAVDSALQAGADSFLSVDAAGLPTALAHAAGL